MDAQKIMFESGNELAAFAAKQINYHIMGYFPITPSTQIAEHLDFLKAEGEHDILLIPADGEHGAAGICYGAAAGGGRVFNATSANGLLYALEQLPVQSGTRFPMVLNVACRTVSGPLSIKGDQSDIMYALNSGWIILYAKDPQAVYDLNICALKIAERVKLPVIVAFDGFFTSHQKRRVIVFEQDDDVRAFLGEYTGQYSALNAEEPVTIGSYMNEPDLMNNKFQLHLAMEEARSAIPEIYAEFEQKSGRSYCTVLEYRMEDAEIALFILGSAFDTAKSAVDILREKGIHCGVFSITALRPFPSGDIYEVCNRARFIVVGDRQDSYGAGGGNLSIELKAALLDYGGSACVVSRIYGLGGRDFYVEDAVWMLEDAHKMLNKHLPYVKFDYLGKYDGKEVPVKQFFKPASEKYTRLGLTRASYDENTKKMTVEGGSVKDTTKMPRRIAPGHGACPGCGIPVNLNLLLKGIEGNVVLLFHTGCAMVITTAYPKTSFRVPYVHNLFQNGPATLSGLVEMFHMKQKRGEIPAGEEYVFIVVSGDGGLDIGMGSAVGTALRNHKMIIFEYDNGGYMNTGYQLSYSTPMGASSSTSHIGKHQRGKINFHKDNPQIMAGTNIPYIATVAESNPADFIRKAAKAQKYSQDFGTVYLKALSACPLNWGDNPRYERKVIEAAIDCCYHPLYEIEQGITTINYNPEDKNKKIEVGDWFAMMGRTKHLARGENSDLLAQIQQEVDRRWERLKAKHSCSTL